MLRQKAEVQLGIASIDSHIKYKTKVCCLCQTLDSTGYLCACRYGE